MANLMFHVTPRRQRPPPRSQRRAEKCDRGLAMNFDVGMDGESGVRFLMASALFLQWGRRLGNS